MFRWFAVFCAVTIAIVAAFLCWAIWATIEVERELRDDLNAQETVLVNQATYSIDQVASEAVRTSFNLNRPCRGEAGADGCGALAQWNKTVIKAGDAVVMTQIVEQKTAPHVTLAMDSFNAAAGHLAQTADALTETADVSRRTIASLRGTAESAELAIGDLDALLKDEAIHRTLDNVDRLSLASAGTVENVQGITADMKSEADALVAPKTKKQRLFELAPDSLKLGWMVCVVVGHC